MGLSLENPFLTPTWLRAFGQQLAGLAAVSSSPTTAQRPNLQLVEPAPGDDSSPLPDTSTAPQAQR